MDQVPDTGQMVFHKDLEANHFVIPGSELSHADGCARAPAASIFDDGTWIDVPLPDVAADPLKFRDEKRYTDRLRTPAPRPACRTRSRSATARSRACR